MDIAFEFWFLLSVLVALYLLGVVHITIINITTVSFRRSVSLFTLFFLVHLFGLTLLHFYTALINPLPFWQWGGQYGGDEINFFNDMNFFFNRFRDGNYAFDYVDQHASDFSVWIYTIAFVSHMMPTSELSAYFVPKLVSSLFVSLTCFYTAIFAKKISSTINTRLLVIFLLLTPDFYIMAGGLFRGSIIAYCLIMVLFLAKWERNYPQIKEILLYLPLLAFILLWLLPNLKIFLNLLLISIIVACVFGKSRVLLISASAATLLVLLVNIDVITTLITFLSPDSYGSIASRFQQVVPDGAESSLAYKLGQHSFVLYVLANILQFFITVPFWSPISSFAAEARATTETLVIVSSHISMSLLLPGLLAVKTKAPKNFAWILFPVFFFSLAMSLTGTVIFRWRFPIMGLLVVILSLGYETSHTKLKIAYFIGIGSIYAAYFALKG